MPIPGDPPSADGPREDRGGQGPGKVLTPFGPVETVPQQGPPANGNLHPQLSEGTPPSPGDDKPIPIIKNTGREHPVPQRDTKPPGEMVVTGASLSKPASTHTGPQPPRRLIPTVVGEPLDQLGDPGPLEPHIPMPPLLERTNEPGIGEHADMLTGSRRRDPSSLGQLPDSPGPPVDERKTHGGPTVISQNSSDLSELHAPSVGREHVAAHRTVDLLR